MPDEPKTRKEVATDDRADPGEDGAWFFVRGADAVRMVRRYFRGDSLRGWLWLLLAGTAVWRFWSVPDILIAIEQVVRNRRP